MKGFCLLTLLVGTVLARKHKIRIEDDNRASIDLSTFGFLDKSYLSVNMTRFTAIPLLSKDTASNKYGFSLDATVSTGISPLVETESNRCILDPDPNSNADKSKKDSVSVVTFVLDFEHNELKVTHRQDKLANLLISTLSATEFEEKVNHLASYNQRNIDKPANMLGLLKFDGDDSQQEQLSERDDSNVDGVAKTDDDDNSEAVEASPNDIIDDDDDDSNEENYGDDGNRNTDPVVGDSNTHPTKDAESRRKRDVIEAPPEVSTLKSTKIEQSYPEKPPDFKIVDKEHPIKFNLSDKNVVSLRFLAIIQAGEEGLYNLFFHNCDHEHSAVNFTIEIIENNNGNYLSAGCQPLPTLFLILSFVYFTIGCFWLYVLRSSTEGVFKMHYLMLTLVWVKSISVLFHSINFYFIQKQGHHEETFAILYYITHLMRGALLFLTIFLIGAGWTFVKSILSDRDKKIFLFVIPLQILANVAQIIIEETEEGLARYTLWKEIFILVDLLCCGAILLPVVWSIRHLQDASQTDGKAAINLQKLKIFRHFYIMIVCYIYFTRIIIYLLQITVPFQYEWLYELFRELATLTFFVVTGYEFRPSYSNPYLQLPTDEDEELEMDEVITQSGVYDGLTHVNVKVTDGNTTTDVINGASTTTPKKRESSHEYD